MVILKDNNTPRVLSVTCDGVSVNRWLAADTAQGIAVSLETDVNGGYLKVWRGDVRVTEPSDEPHIHKLAAVGRERMG